MLVEELAGILRFFVIRQCVIKRHEQTEAGRVNVLAGDDLLFHKSLFPDIFIGTIRYDTYSQFHFLTFHGLGAFDGLFPDSTEGGREIAFRRNTAEAFSPVAGQSDICLTIRHHFGSEKLAGLLRLGRAETPLVAAGSNTRQCGTSFRRWVAGVPVQAWSYKTARRRPA